MKNLQEDQTLILTQTPEVYHLHQGDIYHTTTEQDLQETSQKPLVKRTIQPSKISPETIAWSRRYHYQMPKFPKSSTPSDPEKSHRQGYGEDIFTDEYQRDIMKEDYKIPEAVIESTSFIEEKWSTLELTPETADDDHLKDFFKEGGQYIVEEEEDQSYHSAEADESGEKPIAEGADDKESEEDKYHQLPKDLVTDTKTELLKILTPEETVEDRKELEQTKAEGFEKMIEIESQQLEQKELKEKLEDVKPVVKKSREKFKEGVSDSEWNPGGVLGFCGLSCGWDSGNGSKLEDFMMGNKLELNSKIKDYDLFRLIEGVKIQVKECFEEFAKELKRVKKLLRMKEEREIKATENVMMAEDLKDMTEDLVRIISANSIQSLLSKDH
ncbi:hypothetical protein PPACK8108_LOCUS11569 [Phakopsora pachyrhizi]|uniref:Uncharacterized protein n=1 Tax=Phakopsora pachyrhizi TaxID=170000 RepID=A0AAV0B5E0_PHAPC|nr:hypothetical protein PPACK8108_LOCUS11569 [Phakopsora pachyrhizi]